MKDIIPDQYCVEKNGSLCHIIDVENDVVYYKWFRSHDKKWYPQMVYKEFFKEHRLVSAPFAFQYLSSYPDMNCEVIK